MRKGKKLTIVFTVMILFFSSPSVTQINKTDHDKMKKNMKKIFNIEFRNPILIGEDEGDSNKTFYDPQDFAIDENGNIYLLDSGNYRIQVFNSSGDYLRTLGQRGSGPGELERSARTIAINSRTQLIYVYDFSMKRLTALKMNGKYVDSWYINEFIDDMDFDSKNILLTSDFVVEEKYAPIHRYNSKVKLISSFGSVEEPGKNIFKMLLLSPYNEAHVFSQYKMTNIAVDEVGYIYYSQKNPYQISKYSPDGKLILEFNRDLNFSTFHTLKIEVTDKNVKKFLDGPVPTVGQISIINKNIVAVPIFSPNRDFNIIDFFLNDGTFLYSVQLPKIFPKSTYIVKTEIDDKNNFYCLFGSEDTFPKLAKYNIIISYEKI